MIKYSPIPTSQWWVQTSAFSHYFTKFSGIQDQAQSVDYADGQSVRIQKLIGPRSIQPITLSTPFDPVLHADVIDFWRGYSSDGTNSMCAFITVTITPVTCGETPEPLPGGRIIILPECKLNSVKFGEVDRSQPAVSMIELGFTVNDYSYQ